MDADRRQRRRSMASRRRRRSGVDVLGYHAYAATATWLVSAPAGAPTPSPASPDWQIYYPPLRPLASVVLRRRPPPRRRSSPARRPPPASPHQRPAASGKSKAACLFPIRHVRAQHARATFDHSRRRRLHARRQRLSRDRTPVRASWQTNTARTYGYSISREDGIAIGATSVRSSRRSLGSIDDATTTTADARAYLPGFAPHRVIALRLAGGASIGDDDGRPDVSARRRFRPEMASSISAAAPSRCCAASAPTVSPAATWR